MRDTPEALHDLRVADARWHAVLAATRDAIIAIDGDARITLFNAAAELMFGYRADQVLGRNVNQLMPPPYRDEHDEYLRRYRRTGEAHAIGRIRNVQGRRATGEVFPIELSVTEFHLGKMPFYTAIIREVSERQALVDSLRSERDFAECLIDAAPVIVLVLDEKGRIVRFNRFLECVSGRRLESVRGGDWVSTFVAPRDQRRIRTLQARNRAERIVRNQLCAIVTADGHERQIVWSSNVLSRAGGVPRGYLCIGEDVTDHLSAECELRELEQARQERERLAEIGAFTAKIVHDLGSPLAALSLQTQLILRRAQRGEFQPVAPVEGPAERIQQTLSRLSKLVRELSEFAHDQRPQLQTLSLRPLLRSCVELWTPLAADRGISLRLAEMGTPPRVRADEAMIRRVLDNLIKNALESIEEETGEVIVSAFTSDSGMAGIAVEDSGSGVRAGFDAFGMFESTKANGRGIGLFVAKQMIEAHGGRIEHAPRAGGGTVFRVWLPA